MTISLVRLDGTQTPQQLALIDTGADCSTFPAAWAAQLGIDFMKDCEEIEGNTAGGKTTDQRVYKPGVTAIHMGQKLDLKAVFNPNLPIALLGREDFMSYYKITFDQRKQMFLLDPY